MRIHTMLWVKDNVPNALICLLKLLSNMSTAFKGHHNIMKHLMNQKVCKKLTCTYMIN